MKKITVLLWIVLLFPSITYAQEKVEAPVWNVGDKWVFTEGNIEVVGADEKTYTLNFSKDICIHQSKGFEKIIFDKSTLTRIYGLKGNKREKYAASGGRILNFPFYPGKKWHYTTYTEILTGGLKGTMQSSFNAFKVLGWENVKVQAGNFRTIKLEHFAEITAVRVSGAAIYWYAPEVKYFVKCQYDTSYWTGIADWELASFKLKE
jgi:hypothetical protein